MCLKLGFVLMKVDVGLVEISCFLPRLSILFFTHMYFFVNSFLSNI